MNQPVDQSFFEAILKLIDDYLITRLGDDLGQVRRFRDHVAAMYSVPKPASALGKEHIITGFLDNHEREILTWLATQKNPTTLQSCWQGTNLPEEWWKKAMGRLRQKKLVSFHSRTGKAPLFLTLAGREAIKGEARDE